MGHGDPHRLHAGDHGGGGRRPCRHRLDGVVEPAFEGRIGVVEHVEYDGGGAKMGHLVLVQRLIDGRRLHMAQTDAHPGGRRQGPGETPAVAVKHRQSPEIDAVLGQLPGEHVVDRIEVGTAMVIDHPLGVACGAGGVVEGDRLPLILRQPAELIPIALGKKPLIVELADQLPLLIEGIVDGDQQRLVLDKCQRLLHQGAKLPVHQHHLALGMLEDKGHRLGIESGVDGVEYGAAHGHPEMSLEHGRGIGGDDGDGIPLADAAQAQGRGQLAATAGGLAPALAQGAVDQRRIVGVDPGGPPQKADGGQRLIIGGIFFQIALIDVLLCHRVPSLQVAKAVRSRERRQPSSGVLPEGARIGDHSLARGDGHRY